MSDAQVLGSELRAAREARDLTLEQAEQQTRIRVRYLEALEDGNYAVLPSAVQARGFLRNYARFLNMDADLIVARYDGLQGGRRRRRAQPTVSMDDPTMASTVRRTKEMHPVMVKPPAGPPVDDQPPAPRRRGFQFTGLLIGGVALVILAGLLIVGAQTLQTYLARSGQPGLILSPLPQSGGATLIVPTVPPTDPPRPTPLPSPIPNVDATQASAKGTGSGVVLTLNITERTWIRVTVDGTVLYTGSAAPNTTLKYEGSTINIRVANAIGVRVLLNNSDQGILGSRGQIVDQTYTVNSVPNAPATAPPNPKGTEQTSGQSLLTSPGATFSLNTDPRFSPTPSVLPTRPPSKTPTSTPTVTSTPSITWTPSATYTPSITRTPTMTFTPSITPTASATEFILPHETSTSQGGDVRPQ